MSSLLQEPRLADPASALRLADSGAARQATQRQRLTAFVEERFLVPAYSSPRASLWVAAYRVLSMPFYLQGVVRHYAARREGQDLRIVSIGRRKRAEPLLRRVFGEVRQLEGTATRRLWSPAALESLEADLVIAEVHPCVAPRFRNAGWVVMPDSIRWEGDPEELPPPLPCHSMREDLRKLRRYEYTLEQTTSRSHWTEFYDTMLLPQALSRFGDAAWLPSRRFVDELAARGPLHMVHRDGKWVAAICSVRHGDTLWLPLSGVLNGDPALLQQGISVATFALTFAWARGQGVTRIDAGRTSPFVKDGVHRIKSKWGLRPTLEPLSHLLALRINPGSPVAGAFAAQPVMVETAEGLAAYAGR